MSIFVIKNKQEPPMWSMNSKGRIWHVDGPLVMGIVNATPDSFHAGSRVGEVSTSITLANEMVKQGAAILDIGGQSTRPGSLRIGVQEELDRAIPVIEAIRRSHPEILISSDTFQSAVAKAAVQAGADIVNDISGGTMDPGMIPMVASLKVPFICMHMQGEPSTMQIDPHYEDVVSEVLDYFIARRKECLNAGIQDLIIDPGFGFGKTVVHNFSLLKALPQFRILGTPLLAGLSRKSMITRTLGINASEALNGTTALNMAALMGGANMLRVHDVREAVETVKLFLAIQQGNKLKDSI
jgi:dihydropteroate synthase